MARSAALLVFVLESALLVLLPEASAPAPEPEAAWVVSAEPVFVGSTVPVVAAGTVVAVEGNWLA